MINWKFPYNSPEWLKLRDKHLWKQPYCVDCDITWNLQVDHIIPHNQVKELFLDENNLQTLCNSCHAQKTLKQRPFYEYAVSNKFLKINLGHSKGIKLKFRHFFNSYVYSHTTYPNYYEFNVSEQQVDFGSLIMFISLFYKSINRLCSQVVINDNNLMVKINKYFNPSHFERNTL
ncbi:HNH endonuclease [Mycoplasma bovis]|nr:HNH endonuclease [Mycoplasmopsis bovis]MBT1325036.1 HNH endonuclease [Mycoplasmopsis bovis]MBT1325497.1 HNH endonuclease [Mycoplasmopsis bovis]MBT1326464.1 HNH endonuclease [Mycoplasmopsis bovis]MBT1328353.1 HNH endonuclease [Mycoplasmopsis bovis]